MSSRGSSAEHTVVFAALGLVWLAIVAISLTLACVPPEGLLLDPALPFAARLTALALDQIVSAAVLASTGLGWLGVRFVAGHLAPRLPERVRLTGGRVFRAVGLVAIAACAFAYLTAWAARHQTGEFPGPEAVRFYRESAKQLVQHIAQQSPLLYVGVPLAALLSGYSLARVLPAYLGRASRTSRRRLLIAAMVGLCGTLASLVLGQLAFAGSRAETRDAAGIPLSVGEAYAHARDSRAGPIWSTIAAVATPSIPAATAQTDLPMERRPIVAMDAFLERVRLGSIRRYDVIVIVVESLRRDQLEILGGSRVVMPTVESIAREGLVFERAYTQASHSDLADPCIFSSTYPLRGYFGTSAYVRDPTYPRVFVYDVLKALGWRTALVSSQNETWGGMLTFLRTEGLDHVLHSENFGGPTYVPRKDTTFTNWIKGTKRAGKIDDRFTIGEAIRWIDGGGDAPYFMYVNLQNSHVPYEVPADFERRFAPKDAEFTYTFARISEEEIPLAKDLYADSLAYVDSQIGRLVDHLKRIGRWDRTVLVVTGDTGQAFMEHGFFTHARDLYDEVMRVPIVVRAPGVEPRRDDRLAQHIDIAPTILAVLGIPPHPAFQGVSLVSPAPPTRSAYLTVRTPLAHQYAIVRDGKKLLYDARYKRLALYDLDADPGERHDVSRQRPALARALYERLVTWQKAHVEYYTTPEIHRRTYAPILTD